MHLPIRRRSRCTAPTATEHATLQREFADVLDHRAELARQLVAERRRADVAEEALSEMREQMRTAHAALRTELVELRAAAATAATTQADEVPAK
jgi:DNA gyrase/topoisomerase IV subunit A